MRFAVHHNASVSNKWFNRLSDSLTYGRSGTKHSCSRALICTHTQVGFLEYVSSPGRMLFPMVVSATFAEVSIRDKASPST